jgi:hypothetical protein
VLFVAGLTIHEKFVLKVSFAFSAKVEIGLDET